MRREAERIKITEFLQWNDINGCYTDKNCELEEESRLSYKDAVKYFFGVVNEDSYYSIVDNIFELSYEEIIKYSREKGFYNDTIRKLNILIKNESSKKLYKHLV